jgi:hypothetical protein
MRTVLDGKLEQLRNKFTYSVVTGELYRDNKPACSTNSQGYKYVWFDGKNLIAHRVIWFLVTGEDPGELEVDHIDHDRSNNSWNNLQLLDHRSNSLRQSQVELHPGVTFYKRTGRYQAKCKVAGKTKHLGYYSTAEEASAAYQRHYSGEPN